MDMNRRQFFKVCGVGLGASSMAALGMAPPTAYAESIRHFKLTNTRETRNTCPYCSVGCGLILYSQGSGGKNVAQNIIHIEGDYDHPVNRGTLCPKGAGLLDFVHSPNRLTHPEVREAGSNEWKRIEWSEALDRIARLMKDDRDRNFETHDDQGQLVNRWMTTSMVAASACTNETAYLTQKISRALGILKLDNQARV